MFHPCCRGFVCVARIAALSVGLFGLVGRTRGANWPQWRGPDGNSRSEETNLPLIWNEKQSLVWKVALPEWGNSTPAIWENAVFVTSHKGEDLLLIKLKKETGEIEWTKTVGQGTVQRMPIQPKTDNERREQKFHSLHNLASPSPVTDGKTVVVHFGNGELAAYDFAGKRFWRRNLQEDYGTYTIWWGHANSPVIFGNAVLSVCMQDSIADFAEKPSESYVVAHDLTTGKELWKTKRMPTARAEECDAYTTPVLHRIGESGGLNERFELIVMGGNQVDSYDPTTGKQRWLLPKIVGGRTVSGPTVWNHLAYVTHGKGGPLLAVKLDDKLGERSHEGTIAWRDPSTTPDSCCAAPWGELLFTVTDGGVAKCHLARSGIVKWKERVKGTYKASPVAADGRVYFLNTQGLCTVISAGDRFDRLAENQLDDDTLASPAISSGKIFIRGKKSLYCVGK